MGSLLGNCPWDRSSFQNFHQANTDHIVKRNRALPSKSGAGFGAGNANGG